MTNKNSKQIKILAADDEDMILELYEEVLNWNRKPNSVESELDALDEALFDENSRKDPVNTVKPSFDITLCHQGEEAVEAMKGKISVTISLGVTSTDWTQTLDKNAIISVADKALYDAKREGRNTVQFVRPGD